jgi:hypothetical protein
VKRTAIPTHQKDKENKMRYKFLVSIGAWMMLSGTAAFAGEKPTPVVEPAAQAASVRALKELGGQSGPRLAGMPAPEQMDKTALGEPFTVWMVRLDELQRYQPGFVPEPAALLHDLSTVIYPIRVADEVHGEMVVGKVKGVWSARGFAGPAHVQKMERIREAVVNATGVPAGSTMLVRVPALNIEFIAHRDTAGLQLTPITDLQAADLKAGQTLPAARVFELLSPLAQQHNGLPN